MKFNRSEAPDALRIQAYFPGRIVIGNAVVTTPVIIAGSTIRTDILPARFEDLDDGHILRLADFGTDIVILGSGRGQRFPDPRLMHVLLARGIGVESMDTGAACRCYNVLVAENRAVLAALYMIEE